MSTTQRHSRYSTQETGESEREERLNARLTPEQKAILRKAAALHHQSLSQFVISSAQRAAEKTIQEYEVMRLSSRDAEAMMEWLRNPGFPSPKLIEAAERYKSFINK